MTTRALAPWAILGTTLFVAGSGCSSSGSTTGTGAVSGGGGSGGSGASAGTGGSGGADCNCAKGGYAPVCGVDGKTYDAICGTQCVPVAIACNGQCPCTDGGSGGTGGGTTTSCGTTTCSSTQVCATPGCGGAPPPDGGGGTCSLSPSCEPLPSGCGANPTCDCLTSLWAQINCGSLKYGALECQKPCA